MCRENTNVVEARRKHQALYVNAESFLKWEDFQIEVQKNIFRAKCAFLKMAPFKRELRKNKRPSHGAERCIWMQTYSY